MTRKAHLLAAFLSAFCLCRAAATTGPRRPRITGISHVALWVADLGKSRAFYGEYLGFGDPYTLKNAGGGVSITWMKINDRQSIELFPLDGTKPAGGDSLYHVALETDDAQGMLDYLRGAA